MTRNIAIFLAISTLTALALAACDEDPGSSAAVDTSSDDDVSLPESLGLGDDWVALEPGLWTRFDQVGEQYYLGIGELGKGHAVASLRAVALELEERLLAEDSRETREKLAELRDLIDDVQDAPDDFADDEPAPRCSFNVQAFADAYPIACGAGAKATANFSHPCGSTKGTVTTYAEASCGYMTKTLKCGPKSADPASCSSTTSITGNGPCSSYAFAKIYGVYGVNLYVWDSNNQRGACGGTSTSVTGDTFDCPSPYYECHIP